MYLYETHLHTKPVSKCATAEVRDNLERYKELGYTGVFITNHFIDGNVRIDEPMSYEEKINFFFSDYEDALKIGKEIGIQVLLGVELSYKGTDFLVYGLDKEWFLAHPEILEMPKSEELPFMMEQGALVIQAHPFREAFYIDHIRLFPRCVHGVEVFNACRKDLENEMAKRYADAYGLLHFAGSDTHHLTQKRFTGLKFETPILDEKDFINRVKNSEYEIFIKEIE